MDLKSGKSDGRASFDTFADASLLALKHPVRTDAPTQSANAAERLINGVPDIPVL
jgi:hypothetical protein